MNLLRKIDGFQNFNFLVVFVILIKSTSTNNETHSGCQNSSAEVTSLSFTSTTLTSIAPFLPQRLMPLGWSPSSTVLECARQTVREFPYARGYLYNEVAKLCTPVLYLSSPNHSDALDVEAEGRTLYLASDVCSNGFTIHAFGEDVEPICLQDMQTAVTFDTASSICASHGGFLPSIKTAEKLEFFKTYTGGESRWVGLDDIDTEGVYIWQSDGSVLTPEQKDAVFADYEPNDFAGNEDCIQFRIYAQRLNDIPCNHQYPFVCELPLPSPTC